MIEQATSIYRNARTSPGKLSSLIGYCASDDPPVRASSVAGHRPAPASNTDFFMVTGQKLALGQAHAHTVLTIHIAECTIIIDPNDDGQRTFRRITPQPFRNCKARLTIHTSYVS
jgi:hypothetical protein